MTELIKESYIYNMSKKINSGDIYFNFLSIFSYILSLSDTLTMSSSKYFRNQDNGEIKYSVSIRHHMCVTTEI
jgi:hypothetical protein